MTQLLTLGASFPFPQSVGRLAFKFHWVQTCFGIFDVFSIRNYIQITQSVMPKVVYLLTVQESHKEYNSLMDQIRAKYKQLDSGEYEAVDTPAFNTKACELENLLARVSQLCQKLKLLPPKELCRLMFFKHWTHVSHQNSYTRQAVWLGYGGCSFVDL